MHQGCPQPPTAVFHLFKGHLKYKYNWHHLVEKKCMDCLLWKSLRFCSVCGCMLLETLWCFFASAYIFREVEALKTLCYVNQTCKLKSLQVKILWPHFFSALPLVPGTSRKHRKVSHHALTCWTSPYFICNKFPSVALETEQCSADLQAWWTCTRPPAY